MFLDGGLVYLVALPLRVIGILDRENKTVYVLEKVRLEFHGYPILYGKMATYSVMVHWFYRSQAPPG